MSLERIDKLFNFEKGSLQSSKCTPGQYDFVTAASEWKTHNEYTHDGEYLIFAAAAAGSLGRTHYVNGKFITSDLCFVLSPKNPVEFPIDIQFYHIIFRELKKDIVTSTKAGTSKESISLGSFGKYELPYFPIEKQFETKSRLVDAELSRDELTKSFDDQLDFVRLLRQAFLREAMQGKLVSQDEADEPAEILLQKITAEKGKLIAENKVKKGIALSEVTPEEIPFDLPATWVWCKLGEIFNEIKYGTSKSCSYDSRQNSPVLRIPNVSTGVLDKSDLKFTDLTRKEINELALEEDDILIIRSNGSRELVGETALVTSDFVGFAYAGYLIRLRFSKEFANSKYIMWVTNSQFFREMIEIPLRTTVGINNINTTEISNLLVPLPPIAEQKRIVEKLEKLMTFCDELEANIRQSKHHAETLLQVALKEALEPS